MPIARKLLLGVLIFALAALVLALAILPTYVDKKFNQRVAVEALPVPAAAQAVHQRLFIADLHADALLWRRDLLRRADHGHIDLPRLQEGNVALQVFGVVTKVPRTLSYDRNDDRSDLISPPGPACMNARCIKHASSMSLPARRRTGCT